MSENEEWREFVCPFFVSTCRAVMSSYFASIGLTNLREEETRCIWYDTRVFVDIAHMPETSPNYEIQVFIGFGSKKFDTEGNWQSVPLWTLIPESRQEELNATLSFRTTSDLVAALERCRDALLPELVEPLLAEPAKLQHAIRRFAPRS